jgi:DNA-binding NarL/FixJ family response regulator
MPWRGKFVMEETKPEYPVSVIIAEDQVMMAEGLAAVLEKSGVYRVVGISPNGEHLLHLLNDIQPRVVLLDLNMPVMDGFKACRLIRQKFPSIIVIALTMYNDEKVLKQVKEAGAAGMLLKFTSSATLLQKMNEIISSVNSPVFITTENEGKQNFEAAVSPGDDFLLQFKITPRELEIMQLIAEGMETEEIAKKLFLSVHTVTTHRKNILNKLDLKNAVEVVNFLRKWNIG